MKCTVEWLIQQNEIKGFDLLSGEVSASSEITGINIMDNPDTLPWIAEGVFVLSTGYFLKDRNFATGLIESLAEHKCSGFGIKMDRYITEIPTEMLEQSEKYGFPIVGIPFSSSMDQIANLIYKKIYDENLNKIQQETILLGKISELIINRKSLFKILKKISGALKTDICLIDDQFETIECVSMNL